MINLLSAFWLDDHPIRLNREFHLDLSWWYEFFISWDRLSFLLSPTWAPLPDFSVSSDAAGALACGKMVHCSTTFVNSLQGVFSCSHGCFTLGPQMGNKTGGVLFG